MNLWWQFTFKDGELEIFIFEVENLRKLRLNIVGNLWKLSVKTKLPTGG